METTLVLFKPDSLHRGLCGRILARFEEKGLQIVGMRLLRIRSEMADRHYAEHVGKGFYPGLKAFMTENPVIALALRGPGAIAGVRKLMGKTYGLEAEPGTIRGDFGSARTFNLVHGSDSAESAERELAIFFPDGLEEWTPTLAVWQRDED